MAQEHTIAFGPFPTGDAAGALVARRPPDSLAAALPAMLRYLAAHPSRLATKAEVQQRVWAGTHVTPNVLQVCVREIRAALGDAVGAPRSCSRTTHMPRQYSVTVAAARCASSTDQHPSFHRGRPDYSSFP
jgi:DNA-binding winged helix-turn-helix (wHTH) protein